MPVPRFEQFRPPAPQAHRGILSEFDPMKFVGQLGALQTQQLQQQRLREQIMAERAKPLTDPFMAERAKPLTDPFMAERAKPLTDPFKRLHDMINFSGNIQDPALRAQALHEINRRVNKLYKEEPPEAYTKAFQKKRGETHGELINEIYKRADSAAEMLPELNTYVNAITPLPPEVLRSTTSAFVKSFSPDMLKVLGDAPDEFLRKSNFYQNMLNRFRTNLNNESKKEMQKVKNDLVERYGQEEGMSRFESYRSALNVAISAHVRLLAAFLRGIKTGSLTQEERQTFAQGLPGILQGKDASLKIAEQLRVLSEKNINQRDFYASMIDKGVKMDDANSLWNIYSHVYPTVSVEKGLMPENVNKWIKFKNIKNVGGTGLSLEELREMSDNQNRPIFDIVKDVMRGERKDIATEEVPMPEAEETPAKVSGVARGAGGIQIGRKVIPPEVLEEVSNRKNLSVEKIKSMLSKEYPDQYREL